MARRQYSDELKQEDFRILNKLYGIIHSKLVPFQKDAAWKRRRKSWSQILAMYLGAYAMDMDVYNAFVWRSKKRRQKDTPNFLRLDLNKWIRIPVYPSIHQLAAYALNKYRYRNGSQEIVHSFIRPHINMRKVTIDMASQFEYMCEDLVEEVCYCGVETEGNIYTTIKGINADVEILIHWGYFDKHPIIVPRITGGLEVRGSLNMIKKAKHVPRVAKNLKQVLTKIRSQNV